MKAITAFIPGKYEDAFLYMGRLVAVTEKRSFKAINLQSLVDVMTNALPKTLPVAEFLFLRNDWLASAIFKSMMNNERIQSSFSTAVDEFPTPFFEIDLGKLTVEELELKIKAPHILDLSIYNGRVYFASNAGIHDWDLNWKEEELTSQSKVRTRVGTRCNSLLTGYGAVNASCGNAGLFVGFDEFGWAGGDQDEELTRVQPVSVRTAWVHSNLMNYPTLSTPTLLVAKSESVAAEGYERERKVCVSLEETSSDISALIREKLSEDNLTEESVQFVYNTNNTIFVSTFDGRLFAHGLRVADDGKTEITYSREHEAHSGRILTATVTKLGLVAETDERVLLFHEGNWHTILDAPAISVRGFGRSKRYQNLILIVAEEGIHLVGVFS